MIHAEPEPAKLPALPAQRSTLYVAAVSALVAYVLIVYFGTTASMVSIWRRSDTFAHGFLIVPIFLYLVWRDRAELSALRPAPFWPALAGIVLAAVAAWLGEHLNTVSLPQFAVMAMIPLAIWAIFGTQTLRALAYPLAFLFFAVPFGEFLMPRLIDWTADFTVLAIRASGVPIFREGNSFLIPSGRWSIVEACSGLRYLIASLMVGVLFAYLSYRSAWRRALFIVASIVVPIVANWLRAYMIVMLGHLSGNRIAVGVDHIIYGWIFFGVVMALLFFVGSRWREDQAPQPAHAGRAADGAASPWPRQAGTVALVAAILVAIGGWSLASVRHDARGADSVAIASLPGANGWTPGPAFSEWQPDIAGASGTLREAFVKDGVRIGLHVALFRDQTRDAKAITSLNLLVRPNNARYVELRAGHATLEAGGKALPVRTARVSGADKLDVYQWFWVDGETTASSVMATFYQARALLRGRADAVAWVVVYLPADDRATSQDALAADFAGAVMPSLDAALAQGTEAP
jgi:exosortase A